MASIEEHAGVFRISSGCMMVSSQAEGVANEAYAASVSDLPSVLQKSVHLNNSNNMRLEGNDSGDETEEGQGQNTVNCDEDGKKADWFCINCSVYICTRCQKLHHIKHSTVERKAMDQQISVVKDTYSRFTEQAEVYHKSLLKELGSLDGTLSDALIDVEKAYEIILSRVAEKKQESMSKVKAAILSQKEMLHEKLNSNQQMMDGYQNVIEAGSLSPVLEDRKLMHLPTSLVIPTASVTTDVPLSDLIIPEVKVELTRTLSTVSEEQSRESELDLVHINTIGQKGMQILQFKHPGGVCIDRDSNVYVADEGNNRIQKISKDGFCLGTFAWSRGDIIITDVAYDPSRNQLLVPRASNNKGLLKCSTFSFVTLDGQEVSRFVVPDMVGGLFVSCGQDGSVLISDVVKKTVFVLANNHVQQIISDNKKLKQPAFCTFGKDGEILAVDSTRRAVAVFDSNGLFIRDIGGAGTGEVQLKKPSGVAIDRSCGIVAVTDWCGDKVVLYSYNGKPLASASGFKCPHSVAISNNHHLLVTDCWNSQLKAFCYSHRVEE